MIAYLDMPSGISGDMFLGCLVDGGWALEDLCSTIESVNLPPDSWSVHAQQVMRGPLQATLVTVETATTHEHRHLSHIRSIINNADLPMRVCDRAVSVFTRLAQAEAKIHGTTVEAVHFHEVGALDAIIDIVGVCAGLEALNIEQLFASSVVLGEGWTKSQHGMIPLPAPATLILLAEAKASTRAAPGPGELVTPTGAALLAEFATFRQPNLRLARIGHGAGQRDFEWPNIARLWLGQSEQTQSMVVLESNIDDMNPELFAPVMQELFTQGAVDVWTTPIHMKKQRLATQLSVLAPVTLEPLLADIILRHTTTLGVRVEKVHRYEAAREVRTISTEYGEIRVKLKWVNDQLVGVKPEYDDCVQLASRHNRPVRHVYEALQSAAQQKFFYHTNQ